MGDLKSSGFEPSCPQNSDRLIRENTIRTTAVGNDLLGGIELGKAHFKVVEWYAYSARQMAQSELVFGSYIENNNLAGP